MHAYLAHMMKSTYSIVSIVGVSFAAPAGPVLHAVDCADHAHFITLPAQVGYAVILNISLIGP